MHKQVTIASAARWIVTFVAIGTCVIYLLYVGLFWFGVSTALWKGNPPELSWKMILVLQVAPAVGIIALNICVAWLPRTFDSRAAYVVTCLGGLGIIVSTIMCVSPIIQ